MASSANKYGREIDILTHNKKWLAELANPAKRAIHALLTQDCLLCGQTSGRRVLCEPCINDLPLLPAMLCPCCALPSPQGELCGHCLSRPPHYDKTVALFRYDFPLDKLVQAFKYQHRLTLASFFGHPMAEKAADTQADLIIPLPLHRLRLKERGFNQALELARPVARALQVPIDMHSCQRIRHTPAQASLPWKERGKNIRNAFHCTKDLSGKRILLIDDVMTTGSSLDECARTLKRHGAQEVTLLVLARALP